MSRRVAFVVATDPEVFLLLEAVESDGKILWRYGLVRMNNDAIAIKFRDNEVFRFNKITYEEYRDSTQPYFGFIVPQK